MPRTPSGAAASGRPALGLSAAVVATAAVLALTSAVPAFAAPTAAPGSTAAAGHWRLPGSTITARGADLYPESVAWDPTRRAFVVGSVRYGTLSTVAPDGTVKELAPAFGMVSTLGVKVDVPRGRILVAYTDFWIRQATPVEQPPTSGVAEYDLATGRLLRRTPLFEGEPVSFANDLAVDDSGNVYVTNSGSATIVRIDPDGHAAPLITDPRLTPRVVGDNGIVWHHGGYLVVGHYESGRLFRVTTRGTPKLTEVALPKPLVGADGLTLRPDGSLVVTRNANGRISGIPNGADAVTVLRSHDGWRSARPVRSTDPWPVEGPTAAAATPFGTYVLSGHIPDLQTGHGPTPTFTLRRL
ncbi:hypothetical protein [Kitasatospora sp. GP82]|uniref:hypothetical protein n=1 Tax=Kitasatospora sp. GP82 TaxID=3035089 RepID=UPI0024752996|nr:hypothetical protein [Kitasatospora sp. GP82]MDH6125240.1 sugar lactone lactonase YvrE [Kitasatospora sp. GP82]